MTTSVCTECSGRGWFYSDTGPSGDRDVCNSCDGAGDWDDTGYIERAVVRSPVMMGFERSPDGFIHLGEAA